MATKQEVKVAIEMLKVVSESIRDLGSVPSGYLYSVLMGKVSLDTYNKIINMLEKMKLVEEQNHLLTWIG